MSSPPTATNGNEAISSLHITLVTSKATNHSLYRVKLCHITAGFLSWIYRTISILQKLNFSHRDAVRKLHSKIRKIANSRRLVHSEIFILMITP
jgi:hypothetical protein